MKKYEYISALKFEYLPYDESVISIFENLNLNKIVQDDLKKEAEQLKDKLTSIHDFLISFISDLQKIHEYKNNLEQAKKSGKDETDIDSNQNTIAKLNIESPNIKRKLLREINPQSSKRDVLFSQLKDFEREQFIEILKQVANLIKDARADEENDKTVLKILDEELSKSQPAVSGVLDAVKLITQRPKIEFSNKRRLSLISFLQLLIESIKLTQSEQWSDFTITAQKLDAQTTKLFTVLQDKKELLRASFNRYTVSKSFTPKELENKIKEIECKRGLATRIYLEKRKQNTKNEREKELLANIDNLNLILKNVGYTTWAQENGCAGIFDTPLLETAVCLRKFYKNKLKKDIDNLFNDFIKQEYKLYGENVDKNVLFNNFQKCLDQNKDKLNNLNKIINLHEDFSKSKFRRYIPDLLDHKFKAFVSEEKQKEKNSSEESYCGTNQYKQAAGQAYTGLLRRLPSDFIFLKNIIAQINGGLITQQKSLDKARFFLTHWALLGFDKGKEFDCKNVHALFVPKNKIKDFTFKKLKTLEETAHRNKNADFTLMILYSLTLSALKNKFIAKNAPELLSELNTDNNKEESVVNTIKIYLKFLYKLQINPRIRVTSKVYKKIKNTTKRSERENKKKKRGSQQQTPTIKLPQELKNSLQNILNKPHKTLKEFRRDLESTFYFLQKIHVNKQELMRLLSEYNSGLKNQNSYSIKDELAYFGKVGGYDFSRNISYAKRFTNEFKDLLLKIRSDLIDKKRLNPEVSLYFEAKKEEKQHAKSRHARSRMHIHFMYTKNQPAEQFNPRFADEDEVKQQLQEFNENINSKLRESNNYLRIGIDLGTNDLVSMALFGKWEPGRSIKTDGFPIKKVKFYELPILDDENKDLRKGYKCFKKVCSDDELKEVYAYKNPSFFTHDDEEVRAYKEKSLRSQKAEPKLEDLTSWWFILTTAKVINNKVIINANIMTYIKLRFVTYQTQLINYLFESNEIEKEVAEKKLNVQEIKDGRVSISLDTQDIKYKTKLTRFAIGSMPFSGVIVKWINNLAQNTREELYSIITGKQDATFNDLKDYMSNLPKEEKEELKTQIKDLLEEKQIKLASALANDLVGVVAWLANQYDIEIFMENLPDKFVVDHMYQLKQGTGVAITDVFYKKLLYKLRNLELVPPKIIQPFLLRQKDTYLQYGVAHFVPAEDSSQLCPVCLSQRKDKKAKCENKECGFDLRSNDYEIQDPDILAACNIANPKFSD